MCVQKLYIYLIYTHKHTNSLMKSVQVTQQKVLDVQKLLPTPHPALLNVKSFISVIHLSQSINHSHLP